MHYVSIILIMIFSLLSGYYYGKWEIFKAIYFILIVIALKIEQIWNLLNK